MDEKKDRGKDQGFDRRTLLKAGAWSVPVISLAVATPAYAASGDEPGEQAVVAVYTFTQDGVQVVWDFDAGPEGSSGANVFVSMKGDTKFTVESGPQTGVPTVSFTLSLPASGLDITRAPEVLGTGWSFLSASETDGIAYFTFQYNVNVGVGQESPLLRYTLWGDETPKDPLFPKTGTGVFQGNFPTVTKTVTWN